VVESNKSAYGAVATAAPLLAPSTLNCTRATDTLSDAAAVTLTFPDSVEPAAGDVKVTVGGVVSFESGGGGVVVLPVFPLTNPAQPATLRLEIVINNKRAEKRLRLLAPIE